MGLGFWETLVDYLCIYPCIHFVGCSVDFWKYEIVGELTFILAGAFMSG